MIEIQGNFWEYAKKADAICCTINTTLKYDNLLIMGAGIAKQFAQQYPFLQKDWGDRIRSWTNSNRTYILVSGDAPALVGLPTKFDWRHASPLPLIRRSVQQLVIVAEALNWHNIVMTRPGCGHGGRSWDNEVKPILVPILNDKFFIVENNG